MPRKPSVPSYRLHRASGQAVVVLDGKSIYLGKWNTPTSHAAYREAIAEWSGLRARPCRPETAHDEEDFAGSTGVGRPNDLRISELILAFFEHATRYYRDADGNATGDSRENLADDRYSSASLPVLLETSPSISAPCVCELSATRSSTRDLRGRPSTPGCIASAGLSGGRRAWR